MGITKTCEIHITRHLILNNAVAFAETEAV